MVEFPAPRPQSEVDQHEVTIRGIRDIIEKYTARGDSEAVAIYQDYLAKITGEHPSKLF